MDLRMAAAFVIHGHNSQLRERNRGRSEATAQGVQILEGEVMSLRAAAAFIIMMANFASVTVGNPRPLRKESKSREERYRHLGQHD